MQEKINNEANQKSILSNRDFLLKNKYSWLYDTWLLLSFQSTCVVTSSVEKSQLTTICNFFLDFLCRVFYITFWIKDGKKIKFHFFQRLKKFEVKVSQDQLSKNFNLKVESLNLFIEFMNNLMYNLTAFIKRSDQYFLN